METFTSSVKCEDNDCRWRSCLFCLKPLYLSDAPWAPHNRGLGTEPSQSTSFIGEDDAGCDILEDNGDVDDVRDFVKFLERFVGQKMTVSAGREKVSPLSDFLDKYKCLGCCQECFVPVNAFRRLYHQWKCLELKLEWKMETIVKIMRQASMLPVKTCHSKSVIEEIENGRRFSGGMDEGGENGKTFESIRELRNDVIRKCTKKLLTSQPRVSVLRCCNEVKNDQKVTVLADSNSSHTGIHPGSEPFLGWFITLVAVSLLAIIGGISDRPINVAVIPPNTGNQSPSSKLKSSKFSASLEGCMVSQVEHGTRIEKQEIIEDDSSSTYSDTPVPDGVTEEMITANTFPNIVKSETNEVLNSKGSRTKKSKRNKLNMKPLRYRCVLCNTEYTQFFQWRNHKLSSRMHRIRLDIAKNGKLSRNKSTSVIPPGASINTREVIREKEKSSSLITKESDVLPVTENESHITVKMPANNSVTPAATTMMPQLRYNLRNKQTSCSRSIQKRISPNSSSRSSSCSSEDDEETEANEKSVPSRQKKTGLCCPMKECKASKWSRRLLSLNDAREHRKLHEFGQFKCLFCDHVAPTIIGLCQHESSSHSPFESTCESNSVRKVYHCSRCSFETQSLSSYHDHFAEVHILGRRVVHNQVECDICGQKVAQRWRLIHFKCHHDITGLVEEQIQRCRFEGCSAYFKEKRQLNRHENLMHGLSFESGPSHDNSTSSTGKSDQEEYTPMDKEGKRKCGQCGKSFRSLRGFHLHKKYHRPSPAAQASKVRGRNNFLICSVKRCSKTFPTQANLERHLQWHGCFPCNFCSEVREYAPDLAIHELDHVPESENTPSRTGRACVQNLHKRHQDVIIKCSRCSFKFVNTWGYKNHFLKSHLQLSFSKTVCPVCKEELNTVRGNMKRHIEAHHNIEGLKESEINRCPHCPAYFVTRQQLDRHISKKHFARTFKCEFCNQWCTTNDSLKSHVRTRHPYHLKISCDVESCSKKFTSLAQLHLHKQYFRHPTPKKCPHCDKTFFFEHHLQSHQKVHKNPPQEERFVCPECGKSFKVKVALETHAEFHKDPSAWKFQCAVCGRKCAFKQKLEQHMQTHTKEKPFVCQVCGERYGHRHNWKNHLKTKHPEEYEQQEQLSKRRGIKGNYLSRKGSKKGECIMAGVKIT